MKLRTTIIKFIPLKLLTIFIVLLLGCSGDDNGGANDDNTDSFFASYGQREFKMGFSTWPYAATVEAIVSTETFLMTKGDIYSEHVDTDIPWNAWINDTELPVSFTDMVAHRAARRTSENTMTLSISVLNLERSDLALDVDGAVPNYIAMNDTHIEDAYYKHVTYLLEELTPDYLVISVEADGLLKNAPEKWEAYKLLMANVRSRIKNDYPSLPISESVMLHSFYRPDFGDGPAIISEVSSYINTMDFASISFYPFLKRLKKKSEFQEALDFLHGIVTIPIAFSETGHLSEDLDIDGFDLFIAGNQAEQDDYMQSLLVNAQEQNYEYIIWWTHRDYDPLWETLPEDLKDLGEVWISTGILNEDGAEKEAYSSWMEAFSK